MRARVQKWGNSLALRIPKAVAEHTGFEQGSEVEIRLEGGQMVVAPVVGPRYDLEMLLAEITPENRHGEVDTGVPQGKEVW